MLRNLCGSMRGNLAICSQAALHIGAARKRCANSLILKSFELKRFRAANRLNDIQTKMMDHGQERLVV